MAKEEKEGKGEEVPDGFVEAVNEFYDLSGIIFKCFDDIYSDYLRGKDIQEDLKGLLNNKRHIFYLIRDILLAEEGIKEWFDKVKIEGNKRDKIFEFARRYADLKDEMVSLILREYFGWFNCWIDLLSDCEFDERQNTVVMEIKLLSVSNKKILHMKYSIDNIYELVREIQLRIKGCLSENRDKSIKKEVITDVKKTANRIINDANEVLNMAKELEKKVDGEGR
ncbi:MAG: hypothetical protein GH149_03525 [Methanosarcinales archaeon]|nr:hypothetical protein [Methanosarcinales archaeon]